MKSTTVGAKFQNSTDGRIKKSLRAALFLMGACALLLAASPAMYGQANSSFSGNVTDKSGGGIPGATITVTSQATGQQRTSKTDGAGHYIVPLLPAEPAFTVHVDATGFQSAESKDLVLQTDEVREIDFALNPATVTTTVSVSGNAVVADTTSPSLGQVITSQEVAQLP